MRDPFRQRFTLSQRRAEYGRIESHLQSKIPVVVECGSANTPQIDKEKFLLPPELTVSQFAYVVRRRMKLAKSESIFLLTNNRLSTATSTIRDLYRQHRSDDGFLYITYTTENTFG